MSFTIVNWALDGVSYELQENKLYQQILVLSLLTVIALCREECVMKSLSSPFCYNAVPVKAYKLQMGYFIWIQLQHLILRDQLCEVICAPSLHTS